MRLAMQNHGGNFHTKSCTGPQNCVFWSWMLGKSCVGVYCGELLHAEVIWRLLHNHDYFSVELQDHRSHQPALLHYSMCLTSQLIHLLPFYHNTLSSSATAWTYTFARKEPKIVLSLIGHGSQSFFFFFLLLLQRRNTISVKLKQKSCVCL